jgi:hypothetical protein
VYAARGSWEGVLMAGMPCGQPQMKQARDFVALVRQRFSSQTDERTYKGFLTSLQCFHRNNVSDASPLPPRSPLMDED